MKHILVYSDSLSWGLILGTRERQPLAKRGCAIKQSILSSHGAEMKSTQLPAELTKIAHSKSTGCFGTNTVSKVSDIDGVHLHEKGQLNLGKTLAEERHELKACI